MLILVSLLLKPGMCADSVPVANWLEKYQGAGGKITYDAQEKSLSIVKRSTDRIDVDLKDTPPCASVRKVYFQGVKVSDSDIAALASWPDLTCIHTTDCAAIGDAGAKSMATMLKLEEVVLGETSITSAGLNAFSRHKSIRRLDMSSTNINKSSVRSVNLFEMPALETLGLCCDDAVSISLADLPTLRSFSGTFSSVESVSLDGISSLTEIDFSYSKLSSIRVVNCDKLLAIIATKSLIADDQLADVLRKSKK